MDPFSPVLGVQVDRDKTVVAASMRVRKASEIFIDGNGLAFPETAHIGERISTNRTVEDQGPFINLTFLNSARKPIALSTLDVKVSDANGQPLNTTNQDFEIVLVKSVQRAAIKVALTDRRNGQSWTVDLFPMYRSGTPNLILYSIQNVAVGVAVDANPQYEDKIEISSTVKDHQAKCEAGDFIACNDLALALFSGTGITRDVAEGLKAYNKACSGGNGLACSNLAGVYIAGDGVKQDYAQAMQYFGKGCDSDDKTSCYNLGAMYLNGYGVRANPTEGSRLMAKACKLGMQQACALK
jgi:TPR repeat protein